MNSPVVESGRVADPFRRRLEKVKEELGDKELGNRRTRGQEAVKKSIPQFWRRIKNVSPTSEHRSGAI